MKELKIETKRGVLLDGVLFAADGRADTGIDAIEVSANGTSRTGIRARQNEVIRRWQVGDTAPSKCVSCNSCYRTPARLCRFHKAKRLKEPRLHDRQRHTAATRHHPSTL